MRPIWKNHWLLFRSTHSQKSPEKRDFVVHTQKATAVLLFFYVVRDFATMLHHALRGEPRHTRLTLVFFCKTTCMTRYYGSLWASYESLRTHHENDSASCYFFAVEGVPFPTHHEKRLLQFYNRLDLCYNYS